MTMRLAFAALMLTAACGSGLYATTPAEDTAYRRCQEMIRVTQCPGPPGGFAAFCAFQKWEEYVNMPPARRPAWLVLNGCPAPMVGAAPSTDAPPPASSPATAPSTPSAPESGLQVQ